MARPEAHGPQPLRAASLAWTFFRIGALYELQYRVNFFLQLVQSVVAVGTALAVLALVFSHTEDLGGWSPQELLAVMGVHVLMGGLIRAAIQPSMVRFMHDVREGTLDYALTKPADGQLLVSTRDFRIWSLVDVPVGAALVVYSAVQVESGLGVAEALAFIVALLLGAVMIYCFWMCMTINVFWIVNMDSLVELFEGVYQAGRWPVTIYPGWLRIGFTFLVPLAFAVTVPAEALTGRLDWLTLLGAAGFALLLVAFTRWWWRFGVQRYSGASA